MKKSNDTNFDTQELINKMASGDEPSIIIGVDSDVPVLNLNAVLFGAKYKIKNPNFINTIRNKLLYSEDSFFGIKLSDYVQAALHVLGVQKYVGYDYFINRLIESNFDF